MIKPDLSMPLPASIGTVHFVGIGGSGMSGLARLFLAAGHRVTGSDRADSEYVHELRALGARIAIGHDADNLPVGASALVYTGALWADNPEYLAAVSRGIPGLHRSQALAWLTRGHRVVAVAGAHGKTTTTGMLAAALVGLGADPSFVSGGVVAGLETNAAAGDSDLFVIEADESDGSFLLYDTAVALITNVDDDHLDHYGSYEAVEAAFVEFARRARDLVVISSDDPGAVSVGARLDGPLVTFGESPAADVRVVDIVADGPVAFGMEWGGRRFDTRLRVPGRHNAINAAGAFAVLVGLGFDADAALDPLAAFGGTHRRFELHGTVGGVSVYDDYAHHPAEVRAVLEAARSVVGGGRIIAIHQPHTYSRTARLAGEFAEALERFADETVVLDVFGAREDPVPGVTGALVSERFRDGARVRFISDWQEAADYAARLARPGDFVITLGCGDVNLIVPQLLDSLTARTVS
jgi:UDP-N-acetylmuramate--alanine ligase